jgi:hypothetical protein
MTAVTKQDGNFTGLSYAVEVSPGVVDGSVTWIPLEPNSYKTFGGDVKTKTRMPINASRQLKKGVVVDLNAAGGFQQDLTATNFQDAAQCFMYAALRKKSEVNVATVDGVGHAYQPTSGGDTYFAKDLLFAKSFTNALNNGLKVVAAGLPTASNILVTDTGVVNAAADVGIISRVGYEYGAGEVTVDISGAYPALKVTTVAATGTLTGNGTIVSNGDTVTIGGKVYTFQSALTNFDGNVKIAGTAALSLTNLFNAINGTGGVPGTDYALATVANTRVTATNPTGVTVVVTAKASGAVGNVITTTKVAVTLSWGSGTLTGGSGGRGFDSFGLIPGEFIYIGDDVTTKSFFHATDNGFARVRSITATTLTVDKTQFAMVTDDGTVNGAGGAGNTIRIYFGRVLKNEATQSLIIKRGVQIERTLGAPDDALPTQIQAEYLVRSLADNLKLDQKTADIVRLELDFLANTNELRTGAQGLKVGTRPALVDADAFNTTSDVHFTKMAVVTANNACPTPLFAFFTDLVIDIKNNLKQLKAVSVLGAFDSTPGFFQVQASVTAYFTDVASMQTVRNNSSVTVETHMVKFNKGVSIDLPLVVLSKALADVKLNEPIYIPLAADAATAKLIDPNLDYTMLWVFWDYLPNVA